MRYGFFRTDCESRGVRKTKSGCNNPLHLLSSWTHTPTTTDCLQHGNPITVSFSLTYSVRSRNRRNNPSLFWTHTPRAPNHNRLPSARQPNHRLVFSHGFCRVIAAGGGVVWPQHGGCSKLAPPSSPGTSAHPTGSAEQRFDSDALPIGRLWYAVSPF